MPTRHHLTSVARKLKSQIGTNAFLTIARTDITSILRQVSAEDTTRLKSKMALDLERALLEQGLRCFPSLDETTTGDVIRIFHTGTVLGWVVDLLIHPDKDADRELGGLLSKVKGKQFRQEYEGND